MRAEHITDLAGTELRLRSVSKTYRAAGRTPPKLAVDDVTLSIAPGGSLALIGQSGSGKTTLARLITGIERPTSGTIELGRTRVDQLNRRQLHGYRKHVQIVFQDPYAALNPTSTVGYLLSRPLINYAGLHAGAIHDRVCELLHEVGLAPAEQFAAKLPHELSGGQRQRVVIARALASAPSLIIADEPVSMLDVSLRAGILQLLRDLRERTGISLLYITHDLLSARSVADDFVVLHQGSVVEHGPALTVMREPQHEYTRRLIDAIPNPDRHHRKSLSEAVDCSNDGPLTPEMTCHARATKS